MEQYLIDILVSQVAVFNKINCAYKLLRNLDVSVPESSNEDSRMLDTQRESYKMLIVNYLMVLLGRRKNDKISICKFYWLNDNKKSIDEFYEQYKDEIDNLQSLRDKVYSHFDLDYITAVNNIKFEFIETCIDFLNNIFQFLRFLCLR